MHGWARFTGAAPEHSLLSVDNPRIEHAAEIDCTVVAMALHRAIVQLRALAPYNLFRRRIEPQVRQRLEQNRRRNPDLCQVTFRGPVSLEFFTALFFTMRVNDSALVRFINGR